MFQHCLTYIVQARRRYLRSLLHSSRREPSPSLRRRKPRQAKKVTPKHTGRFVPGYTVLVIDTNIILSSLALFISLVETLQWTVVVPLPVIMELDGLSSSSSPQLAETAKAGLDYISSHLKSLSISLKVQTSKGNYLSSLSVRTEQVDFDNQDSWDRNMDDLILRAAIWHDEHWLDRSAILTSDDQPARDTTGASKVVLLSLDRNCMFLFLSLD
jgi:protein SMG6